ncbi:MAG: hemerythrin domain-containing protein [Gammaproteobacteria bacterium]|nr:hemerythrin domain-containing protein [Gammaproteobacteria bacterium]
MNIITILKADHKEVAALLKKLLKEKVDKSKESVFSQIYEALSLHAKFEEKTFYPAVKKTAKTKDLVLESYVEHDVIKTLLSDIKKMSPKDELWKAKVTVLQEVIKHHVKEEEEELFPKAKKILDKGQLDSMGEKYHGLKEKS